MIDEAAAPVDRFFDRLSHHLEQGSLAKLVLAKHRGEPADLVRLAVRPLALHGDCLLYTSDAADE